MMSVVHFKNCFDLLNAINIFTNIISKKSNPMPASPISNMKKICFLLFSFLFCLNVYSQNKYSDVRFVGKTFTLDTSFYTKKGIITSLVYDIPNNNITYSKPRLVQPRPDNSASDFKLLVGKQFKCIEAKQFDNGRHFYLKLYSTTLGTFYSVSLNSIYYVPRVENLTCIEDETAIEEKIVDSEKYKLKKLDSVRKLYINKTIWIKTKDLNTYDTQTNTYDKTSTPDLRFTPVTVTQLTFSDNNFNHYRLFAKISTGKIIYFDFDLDRSAKYGEMITHTVNGKNVFEARNRLSDGFYLKNPITAYHLTSSLIKTIKKGDIYIGMSASIVKLIKGEPDHINRTTNGYGIHEQWVYNSPSEYYYFDNNKLTSVQN